MGHFASQETGLYGAVCSRAVLLRLATAVMLAWLGHASAWAQVSWSIVVPWRPPQVSVDVPALFERALQRHLPVPVQIQQAVYNQQDEALAWSLQVASVQPSLVLFSEELALLGNADQAHPRHLSHYEPVMMVWQTRWCLYVAKDSPLQQPDALQAWMYDPQRTPVIAIPEAKGRLSIWVKGMERRTHRRWQVQPYGLKGSIVEPLVHGDAVALSYCNRQRLHPDKTRIIAQSGMTPSPTMPDIPLFTDLNWLPMQKGWMAWMVPKAVPHAQRAQMEAALERIMQDPAVLAQLRGSGHVVQAFTVQEARATLQSFTRAWRDIDEVLQLP